MYFLDNMVSGRIYFYINMNFGWLTWLGTGVLLLLGATNAWDILREARSESEPAQAENECSQAGEEDSCCESDEHHAHEHSHDHAHSHAPSWPKLALIAVPLIVGALVPARPLGAAAVGTMGVSNTFTSVSSNTTQLVAALKPSNERNVLDWIRAFNNSSNVDEFTGQQADLIGFVYRDIRFKDETQQFMVARFALSCCVADASAIGVTVQFPEAAKLVQDSWVHVTGKFQVQDVGGQRTPILIAQAVDLTQQPAQPYVYP